jgi:hypothetical protein
MDAAFIITRNNFTSFEKLRLFIGALPEYKAI